MPESIWKALEFGASRIGHGVRCLEDKALVRRLAKDEIPLELCPTSNANTKIFKNITDYPILQLLDEGIKATINTDNMTASNTTLRDEINCIGIWKDLKRADKVLLKRLYQLFLISYIYYSSDSVSSATVSSESASVV